MKNIYKSRKIAFEKTNYILTSKSDKLGFNKLIELAFYYYILKVPEKVSVYIIKAFELLENLSEEDKKNLSPESLTTFTGILVFANFSLDEGLLYSEIALSSENLTKNFRLNLILIAATSCFKKYEFDKALDYYLEALKIADGKNLIDFGSDLFSFDFFDVFEVLSNSLSEICKLFLGIKSLADIKKTSLQNFQNTEKFLENKNTTFADFCDFSESIFTAFDFKIWAPEFKTIADYINKNELEKLGTKEELIPDFAKLFIKAYDAAKPFEKEPFVKNFPLITFETKALQNLFYNACISENKNCIIAKKSEILLNENKLKKIELLGSQEEIESALENFINSLDKYFESEDQKEKEYAKSHFEFFFYSLMYSRELENDIEKADYSQITESIFSASLAFKEKFSEIMNIASDVYADTLKQLLFITVAFEIMAKHSQNGGYISLAFSEKYVKIITLFIENFYNSDIFPEDVCVLSIQHRFGYYLALSGYEKETEDKIAYVRSLKKVIQKCSDFEIAKDIVKSLLSEIET